MENLTELLKTRRSYRRFFQKPISDDIIKDILLSARYASSAANRQPLRYIAIKDASKVSEVFANTKWAAMLPPEIGQPKDDEKPVFFVAVVADNKSSTAEVDAGLAISNMTLVAWEKGIGSCIIGNCNRENLSHILKIGENERIVYLVAFGYPSHKSTVVDAESGESTAYYVDEKRDYFVPKYKLENTVTFL